MCIGCDIINEGRTARLVGESIAACPYPMLSPFAAIWVQGWVTEDEEFIESSMALFMQTRREEA